jgi:hypothetical protein
MNETFRFAGNGIWVNDTYSVSVALNEDYGRTFRAYADARPYSKHLLRNAAGNPIRFRSREAAMAYALGRKRRA